MGLFSKEPDLFDDSEDDVDSEPITLFTNAPTHWPAVLTDPLIPDGIPGAESMNLTTFGAAIKRTFEGSNCGCQLEAMLKAILTPDGILEIPFLVNDSGRFVPVFLYSDSNEMFASQYYAAYGILQARGYSEPVYYAPGPLPQAPPGNPFRPFSAELLTRHKGGLPKGNYAMMWSDESNPDILTSKCLKDIHRSFQALAGVESYVLASIFRALGLVEGETARMKLPQKTMTIPIVGPEDQAFILSVSEEKGIRFHFNSNLSGPEYRDSFWAVFASYAEKWKNDAVRQQMELAYQKGTPPSVRYWTNTVNMLYKQTGGVSEFGVLTI
jgi:hypothetical protein